MRDERAMSNANFEWLNVETLIKKIIYNFIKKLKFFIKNYKNIFLVTFEWKNFFIKKI